MQNILFLLCLACIAKGYAQRLSDSDISATVSHVEKRLLPYNDVA